MLHRKVMEDRIIYVDDPYFICKQVHANICSTEYLKCYRHLNAFNYPSLKLINSLRQFAIKKCNSITLESKLASETYANEKCRANIILEV